MFVGLWSVPIGTRWGVLAASPDDVSKIFSDLHLVKISKIKINKMVTKSFGIYESTKLPGEQTDGQQFVPPNSPFSISVPVPLPTHCLYNCPDTRQKWSPSRISGTFLRININSQ